jgi:hypothetical protein
MYTRVCVCAACASNRSFTQPGPLSASGLLRVCLRVLDSIPHARASFCFTRAALGNDSSLPDTRQALNTLLKVGVFFVCLFLSALPYSSLFFVSGNVPRHVFQQRRERVDLLVRAPLPSLHSLCNCVCVSLYVCVCRALVIRLNLHVPQHLRQSGRARKQRGLCRCLTRYAYENGKETCTPFVGRILAITCRMSRAAHQGLWGTY